MAKRHSVRHSTPVRQTAIEVAGNWGLDFAFIDAEHTPVNVDTHMEKLVMAALLSGIAPLVRVRGTNEWDIRKSLENRRNRRYRTAGQYSGTGPRYRARCKIPTLWSSWW
jgi:hypothetical protein